jgi:hypothetical protein
MPPSHSGAAPKTPLIVGTSAESRRDSTREPDYHEIAEINHIPSVAMDIMKSEKASTPTSRTNHGTETLTGGRTNRLKDTAGNEIKTHKEDGIISVSGVLKSDRFRYRKPENPVKLQGRVLREERELARTIREKLADDAVAEKIRRLNDTIARFEEVVGLPRQALVEWNVAEEVTATEPEPAKQLGDDTGAEKIKRLQDENKHLEETVARLEGLEISRKARLEQEVAAEKVASQEAMKEQREKEKMARLAEAEESRKAWLERETAEKLAALALIQMATGPTNSVQLVGTSGYRATVLAEPKTAATNELISDPKSGESSAEHQRPTVEKLDEPTTLHVPTSTGTSDEILASALPRINITKAKAPATVTPAPQYQTPPDAKPSPSNPFYRSEMTLGHAARNIVAYFREAADWLTFWHISTSSPILLDMSRKPASTLNQIFNHLAWTAEFLRLQRQGWDLRRLPDNFFEDVLPLIMVTCGKLEKLGEWKGCEGMMHRAWRHAEEVGEMLATLRIVRVRDGKEKWARDLGLQEVEGRDETL